MSESRPSRRYREWVEDDVQNALREVRLEQKSVYAASKAYNLPRSTLDDRFKERHGDKVGRRTKLEPEDEETLVRYSMYMAGKGFPLTAGVMKVLAKEIDKESSKKRGEDPRFGGKTPGKRWWSGFRLRHPQISLRSPDRLDRARAAMSNPNTFSNHFAKLDELLTKHSLHQRPFLVYNADETGMELDARRSRVVVPTASKRAPAIRSGGRDHVTVMACVSAAGAVLPPMVIYDKNLPSGRFSEGGPPGAVYAHSASGFINRELFQDWFFKIFVPHCHQSRPILLLLDQHTDHLSLNVLEAALAQDIIIYGLPPHTSQCTQPLDATVFSSLKAKWSKTLEALQVASHSFQVKKSNFARIYSSVQDDSFTADNIKASFAKTGVLPFNPKALDKVWMNMTSSTGSEAGPSTSSEAGPSTSTVSTSQAPHQPVCTSCGNTFDNPVVNSLVPPHLRSILRTVTSVAKQTRRKKLVARVLTHEDVINDLKKKEEEEKQKKAKGEERKKKAEMKKAEEEERKEKAEKKKAEAEERKKKTEKKKEKKHKRQGSKRNGEGRKAERERRNEEDEGRRRRQERKCRKPLEAEKDQKMSRVLRSTMISCCKCGKTDEIVRVGM
ncbi:uncharacterized protein [Branchiostoma lanceolatum]|uniref:uncharacterized protein n=1 Tax=Branchiostoma lanceolatum TaxID=7740 RepID=UPI0034565B00